MKKLAGLVLASSLLVGCSTIPRVGLDEIVGIIPNGNEVGLPIVVDKHLKEIAIYEVYFDAGKHLHLLYEGYVTRDGKYHPVKNPQPTPQPQYPREGL